MPSETRCVRIMLKPGALDAVRDWQSFINAHRDDVLQTLAAEGVTLEMAFLEQNGAESSLIYIMRCADFEKAFAAAQASESFIDAFHKKFKQDWWGERRALELLIEFHR